MRLNQSQTAIRKKGSQTGPSRSQHLAQSLEAISKKQMAKADSQGINHKKQKVNGAVSQSIDMT